MRLRGRFLLSPRKADVLALLMDVSKVDDVKALARKTLDAYGAVHFATTQGLALTASSLTLPYPSKGP